MTNLATPAECPGGLAVVGLPDPWESYGALKMGQWPDFLVLPGIDPPNSGVIGQHDWRIAAHFAAATSNALTALLRTCTEPQEVKQRVSKIE